MSLRGVGKAIYRTPHQLFAQKSTDDEIILQWEHDIKNAIAGLDFLQLQQKKLKSIWSAVLWNNLDINHSLSLFHRPLEDLAEAGEEDNDEDDKDFLEAKVFDDNEQFSNITTHELKQASKLFKTVCDKITEKIEFNEQEFNDQTNEMKDNLKHVLKLITKRNHKKIDYDMHHNSVQKLLSNNGSGEFTNKDKKKLQHGKKQLDETTGIFNDLDNKVRLVLPQVMETLSEFVNKLALKAYYQNLDIVSILNNNLNKYSVSQGLNTSKLEQLTYKRIIAEFEDEYSQTENKLHNLTMLKEYKELRTQTMKDRTIHTVNTAANTIIGSAAGFTNSVYTKVTSPNQKLNIRNMNIDNPVKPYSKEGMFSGASSTDPIKFITTESYGGDDVEYEQPEDYPISDPEEVKTPTSSTSGFNSQSQSPTQPVGGSGSEKDDDSDAQWLKPLSLKKSREPQQQAHAIDEALALSAASKKQSLDETEAYTPSYAMSPSQSTVPTSTPTTPLTSPTQTSFVPKATVNNNSKRLSWAQFQLPSHTETAKYVNISNDAVKSRIRNSIIKPNINLAPITDDFKATDGLPGVLDSVKSRSSITANLFLLSTSLAK